MGAIQGDSVKVFAKYRLVFRGDGRRKVAIFSSFKLGLFLSLFPGHMVVISHFT